MNDWVFPAGGFLLLILSNLITGFIFHKRGYAKGRLDEYVTCSDCGLPMPGHATDGTEICTCYERLKNI